MSDEEIAKVKGDVRMLPVTGGSVVLGYNVPGKPSLRLSRQVYSRIFLGEISNWNHPDIQKLNPKVRLPNLKITVVHRSDGSGTTAIFTRHLEAISAKWAATIKSGKSVSWPNASNFVGAKGNEGVTAVIAQTAGAIGYLEYGYALSQNIPMAALENRLGVFVAPSTQSARAGLAGITLGKDLRGFDPDPKGKGAYPIVSYTWLLVRNQYPGTKGKAMEVVVEYILNQAKVVGPTMGYVPLPEPARKAVAASADSISKDYKINLR